MTAIEIARECGAYDWKANIRGPVNGVSFTDEMLSTFVQRVKDEAYEEAAKACELEKVDAASTDTDADRAYNLATEHCAGALRSLKGKP